MVSAYRTTGRVSGELVFVLLGLRKALEAEWNRVEEGQRVVMDQYREQVEVNGEEIF